MNSFQFRTGMVLGTAASLLLFLTGCPPQQRNQQPQSTAPPPIISHHDLQTWKHMYSQRLNAPGSEVRGQELLLVDFRDDTQRARQHLYELRRDVERHLKSRGATITSDLNKEWDFSFRYHNGKIHGHVECTLMKRPNQERWDIVLKVREEPRT